MNKTTIMSLAICLAALACINGCTENDGGSGPDAQLVASHRAALVLDREPDDVMSITELREQLEGSPGVEADDHAGEEDPKSHDVEGREDDGDDVQSHDPADHEAHDGAHQHVEDPGQPQLGLGSMNDISVVGKISKAHAEGSAMASDYPWEKGAAAFVIVDPAAEGAEEAHTHADGEDCNFCATKKVEANAVVQFSADGGTIKVDARDLFGLKVDEIVVVRGDAAVKGGVLIIDADGIYVRR